AVTVVNAAGAILPTRGGAGDGGTGEPDTTLQWFDAAGIAGHPKELRLHITVPWIDGLERLHAPPAAGPSRPLGQKSPATVTSTVATAQAFPGLPTNGAYGSVATARPIGVRDPWMQEIRVYGPISFDLTIPYERDREARPNQQVTAGGVTAVLQRVVISPTEMRIYVGGLEPNTFGILSTDGWDASGTESTDWRSGDTSVYSFLAPLMDKHGQWTLVIKPGPVLHLPAGLAAPPGSTPAKGGPWTFHFTVP
ncbi:MAG: hypothetical protein M3Z66_12730, partial [Chloroflexota bacterium]|nr:hypothetical protein [Chloroflexota bacterium]